MTVLLPLFQSVSIYQDATYRGIRQGRVKNDQIGNSHGSRDDDAESFVT